MTNHLTDEQERIRLEGLRILARIIARHAQQQPGPLPDGSPTERQPPRDHSRRDGDKETRRESDGP